MLLKILNDQCLMFEGVFAAGVVLGRQEEGSQPLYRRVAVAGGSPVRVNIAGSQEKGISCHCLEIEPLPLGAVRITNLKQKSPATINGTQVLQPGMSHEAQLPVIVSVLNKMIQIDADEAAEEDQPALCSLAQPTIAPGAVLGPTKPLVVRGDLLPGQSESLLTWFRTVTAVLQSAAGAEDFLQRAAEAAVELVGLSCGRVLLYEAGEWPTAAAVLHSESLLPLDQSVPSRRMLARLLDERRTFWQSSSAGAAGASLQDVQAVVAAPILDRHGQVIGALYGDRRGELSMARPFTPLEAQLVETLAGTVAAGLARVEQQRAAVAAQVRFEQFFTPELSRHLTAQPDLLNVRDAEVTLLFCDVRGFSRISERLGPAASSEWMNSVINALSDCVSGRDGVLVDYIGDELMAMWGAPAVQPDHAQLACLAAADMLEALKGLNAEWSPRLNEPIQIGIGINTGMARVGNSGSRRKFKYGPLGTPVNLASRVQGATKYLRTDLLVTAATRNKLGPEIAARRLCKVRVVNISEPVDLYQLPVGNASDWRELCEEYEAALEAFEGQHFSKAASILSRVIGGHADDGPSLALLSRTVERLMKRDSTFSPVWELPGK